MPEDKLDKNTGRLEAFSDGVFAIAITLLVLELKVPHFARDGTETASHALASGLRSQWPGYFAFVTSFFTILIMWVHHHHIFRMVRRVDVTLLFTNGLMLMLVTVIPFPTAVIAEYLRTPAAPAACALYAGTLLFGSIVFYLLMLAAFRKPVREPDVPEARMARMRRDYRWGPPLYLAATVAAPFSPWLAMTICTALWIFWAATTRECA